MELAFHIWDMYTISIFGKNNHSSESLSLLGLAIVVDYLPTRGKWRKHINQKP